MPWGEGIEITALWQTNGQKVCKLKLTNESLSLPTFVKLRLGFR